MQPSHPLSNISDFFLWWKQFFAFLLFLAAPYTLSQRVSGLMDMRSDLQLAAALFTNPHKG